MDYKPLTKFVKLWLLNVHPITEENDDVTKDFCSRLETLYDSLLRNKLKILLGYLNIQIGNKGLYRETTGRHSF